MPREMLLQWSNVTRKAKGGVGCSCSLPKHWPRGHQGSGHPHTARAMCSNTEQTNSGWGTKSECWDPIYQHRMNTVKSANFQDRLTGAGLEDKVQSGRLWLQHNQHRSRHFFSTCNTHFFFFESKLSTLSSLLACWTASFFFFQHVYLPESSLQVHKHFNCHKNDGGKLTTNILKTKLQLSRSLFLMFILWNSETTCLQVNLKILNFQSHLRLRLWRETLLYFASFSCTA